MYILLFILIFCVIILSHVYIISKHHKFYLLIPIIMFFLSVIFVALQFVINSYISIMFVVGLYLSLGLLLITSFMSIISKKIV